MFARGLEHLTRDERRVVRRAIAGGERLKKRRLASALVAHTRYRLEHHDKLELLQAFLVTGIALAGLRILDLAFGVPIGPGLLLGSAVGFLLGSYVFARPRRRRMYEQALDLHTSRRRREPRSG